MTGPRPYYQEYQEWLKATGAPSPESTNLQRRFRDWKAQQQAIPVAPLAEPSAPAPRRGGSFMKGYAALPEEQTPTIEEPPPAPVAQSEPPPQGGSGAPLTRGYAALFKRGRERYKARPHPGEIVPGLYDRRSPEQQQLDRELDLERRRKAELEGRTAGEADYAASDYRDIATVQLGMGFKQALGSGIEMAGRTVDELGFDETGAGLIRRGARLRAASPVEVNSMKEIEGVGDAVKYVLGGMGKMVGYIAPTVAAGIVGGVPGALAAAGAFNVGENLGELDELGDTSEAGHLKALTIGAINTGLDVITPGKIAKRLGKVIRPGTTIRGVGNVTADVVRRYAGAKTVLTDMAREALTETIQEETTYIGTRLGTDEPIEAGVALERGLEAGFLGLLGGGTVSAATVGAERSATKRRAAFEERKKEAAAALEEGAPEAIAADLLQELDQQAPGQPPVVSDEERAPTEPEVEDSGPSVTVPPAQEEEVVAPEPEQVRAVEGVDDPNAIIAYPTEEIGADPERFQFKGEASGSRGRRKRIETWNKDSAGIISVWRDPETGKVWVVNGHLRLEAAKRLGVKKVNVQFTEALTAEEARSQGAITNINDGQGEPVDFAKFMRDTGLGKEQLEELGVRVSETKAAQGLALSRLEPSLFQQVATGKIKQDIGIAVAEEIADHQLQIQAMQTIQNTKRVTVDEAREIARQFRLEGTESVAQDDMFGGNEERRSLVVPKAQLVAKLRQRLGADKRLFGFVAKEGRAEQLEGAGDTSIDVQAAAELAQQSAAITEVFDRLYQRSGPIARIVTDAARRIAVGEKPGKVAGEIYDDIREAVLAESTAGTRARGRPEGGPTETGGVRTDETDAGAAESGRGDQVATDAGPTDAELEAEGQDNMFGQPSKSQPDFFAETPADQNEMFGAQEVGQDRPVERKPATPEEVEQEKLEKKGEKISPEEIVRRLEAGESLQADKYQDEIETGEDQARLLSPTGHSSDSPNAPENRSDNFGVTERKTMGLKPGNVKHAKTLRQMAADLAAGINTLQTGGPPAVFKGRLGGLAKVAKGWFDQQTEEIRTHRLDWLDTIAHEMGHYVSKGYLGWPTRKETTRAQFDRVGNKIIQMSRGVEAELVSMGRALYGNRRPSAGYGEEGIAEAFKFFVTNPEHLKAEAPGFYEVMQELFAADPAFAAPWQQAQTDYAAWEGSPLTARVLAKISIDPQKWSFWTGLDFVRAVSDDLVDIRVAVRELADLMKKGVMRVTNNPYVLARLLKGLAGVADNIVNNGYVQIGADGKITRLTRPLRAAIDMIPKGQLNQWRTYLVGMSALDRYAYALTKIMRTADPNTTKRGTHEHVLSLSAKGRAELEFQYSKIMGGASYGDVGFWIAEAEAVTTEEQHKAFREASEIVWENEAQAIRQRQGILLTDAQVKRILEAHPHHVSFQREFDASEFGQVLSGGGYTSSGVPKQTGSGRRVIDPVEGALKNVYQTVRDVQSRRVIQSLVSLSLNTEGGGRILTPIDNPREHVSIHLSQLQPRQVIQALLDLGVELPKYEDGTTFNWTDLKKWLSSRSDISFDLFLKIQSPRAWENSDMAFPVRMPGGEKQWVQFNPRMRHVYEALQGTTKGELDAWFKLLGAPTRVLRIGATSTFEFGIANVFRDLFTAAAYSRARVGIPLPGGGKFIVPGAQVPVAAGRMVKAMASLLRRDEWYQKFQLSGGDISSMLLLDRQKYQTRVKELYAERGKWSLITYFARHPIDFLRLMGSISEQANRIGEFRAVYEAATKKGDSPQEAMLKGGFAAREITQDFAKMGKLVRIVNQLIPFAGAQVGGMTKLAEEAFLPVPAELRNTLVDEEQGKWDRAQEVWAHIAVGITLPSLALYALQKDDPEYQKVPRWQKSIGWVVMTHQWAKFAPAPVRDWLVENIPYVVLPKPPFIGQLFGSIPELLAESAIEGDEKGASHQALNELGEQLGPFNPINFLTDIAYAKPIIENLTNKSLFFNRPVENRTIEGRTMEERFTGRTSETAIAISQSPVGDFLRALVPGVAGSPAKVENLVRGYTGGVGKYALSVGDVAVRGVRSVAGRDPYKTVAQKSDRPLLTRIPGLSRIFKDLPEADAQTIQTFYEKYEKASEHFETWKSRRKRSAQAGATYRAAHPDEIRWMMTQSAGGYTGSLRAKRATINKVQAKIRSLEGKDSERARTARKREIEKLQKLAANALDSLKPRKKP